jgi:hypothetical protein
MTWPWEFMQIELPNRGVNLSSDDVACHIMDNHVSIEWIDHAYLYGLHYLDYHYMLNVMAGISESINDERLERLKKYGKPVSLIDWSTWWKPDEGDWEHTHILMYLEEKKEPPLRSFEHPAWLLYGESEVFTELCMRVCLVCAAQSSEGGMPQPEASTSTMSPTEMPNDMVSTSATTANMEHALVTADSGSNDSLGMSELGASLPLLSEDVDMNPSPMTDLSPSPSPKSPPGATADI